MESAYVPRVASRSEFIPLRGIQYHVRRWGNPEAPMLFLLHGWLDMSATWQFVVDSLAREWNIIAPDWRGYGLSEAPPSAAFLMEYLADLDALLDHYSPDAPVRLVGHSMGGNLSGIYASTRPERFSHWINLDGAAPMPGFDKDGAARVLDWLQIQAGQHRSRRYASLADFAARLLKANRRLSPDRALFLAGELCRTEADGSCVMRVNPYAEAISPVFPHRLQILLLWRNITAKTLFVRGDASFVTKLYKASAENWADLQERLAAIPDCREVELDATHNMQHDNAEAVAALIEAHLADSRP